MVISTGAIIGTRAAFCTVRDGPDVLARDRARRRGRPRWLRFAAEEKQAKDRRAIRRRLIGACEGAPAGARKLALRIRMPPRVRERPRGAPQGAYERRRELPEVACSTSARI